MATGAAAAQIAADSIRQRLGPDAPAPVCGIVLGSGLGGLADRLERAVRIPFSHVPGFPTATVAGHAGQLLVGTLGGRPVVALAGRFHLYEGHDAALAAFPVRVMHALGATVYFASNAAGGVRRTFNPGDLMVISDHINLLGDNPLIGPNDDTLGARFPDMSEPYDPALRALARDVASQHGITIREGVYVAVQGPNLETRAEYRFLRGIGADVVGMSTVPEVIVALHGGMRVLGLSIITDKCLPDALEPASLAQIVGVARSAEPKLAAVVKGVIARL